MFKVESKKVIEYMLFLECDGGTVQHNLATQLTRAALLAVQSFRTRRRVGAAGKRSGPRWLYARLLLTARPCLSRTKPIGNNCDPRTSNFLKIIRVIPHKALGLVLYLKLWKFMEDFAGKKKREKCS